MKKLIIFGFFLSSIVGVASAKTDVNCDNVRPVLNTIDKNNLVFGAYWKDESVFPNPPKSKVIGNINNGSSLNFSFVCPHLMMSKNGNILEIRADNYDDILNAIGEHYQDLDLYHYSSYRYPNIRSGLIVLNYAIDLKTFDIKSSGLSYSEGGNFNNPLLSSKISSGVVIGYRVDGSELKPLLYDQKIYSYKADFEKANIIEIYHKIPNDDFEIGANIEKIYINKKLGILRIYRKNLFPLK